MKIAIDARFYGLENGGLGRYTINLINELQKIDSKNQYYLLLRNKYYTQLNLSHNFHKIKAEARHYSVKEQILIPYLLYKVKPDVTHFLHFNVPVLFFGKNVVTIHDLLMHRGVGREATTRNYAIYLIKRFFYRVIFDLSIKRAKRIIVPTEYVKNEVTNEYKKNFSDIIVTYEGTTLPKNEALKITKTGKYFLYVGNAYPHKNVKILILAASKLPKIKFVIVTPRDVFMSRLKNLVEKYKVSGQIDIKSGISDGELVNLYINSYAFVYPSFSEGFGLQGVEAMSVGTRLIASKIPVFKEVYSDNAIYFDPDDVDDLVSKMKKILSEGTKIRNVHLAKAKKFVSKYSWEKMAYATLGIYEGF